MEEPIKIAVCLVGQSRTSNFTHESIKEYLSGLLDHCDFYIHTWNINTPAPGIETNVTDIDYISRNLSTSVSLSTLYQLKENYKPKKLKVDKFIYDPNISCPGFYISLKKALDLIDREYDFIVVLRPDLVIDSSKKLFNDLELLEKSDFVFTDKDEDGEGQVDSVLWVFKYSLKEKITEFCRCVIETHAMQDDQIFFKNWLSEQNIKVKAAHNKSIWIFRWYHLKEGLPAAWLAVKYYDKTLIKR